MITFDVRSEGEGELRISTSGETQIPANQYWPHVQTDEEWTTFKYIFLYNDPNSPIIAGSAEAVELNFDMGKVADMTYYIDNIKVIDITGLGYEVAGLNLFADGTFESFADLDAVFAEGAFQLKNGEKEKAELLEIANPLDASSTKVLKLVSKETSSDDWDLQLATPFIPLVEGNQYKVVFDIRSEGDGELRISTSGADQIPSNQYWPHVQANEEWIRVEYLYLYNDPLQPIVAGEAETVELNFDMGKVADMIYYIDNIKIFDVTGTKAARYVAPDPVSIQAAKSDQSALKVYTNNGSVSIIDVVGKTVDIYSVSGVLVYSATATVSPVSIQLESGLYIVVVDKKATKVLVK